MPALYGSCAQGALGRAGFRLRRSANLHTAATLRLAAFGDGSICWRQNYV
jgi:hypothetical protein